MKDTPKFEIPETVRDMAERNVEQARGAYSQFLDMARKAQDTVAKSTDVMAEGARELQEGLGGSGSDIEHGVVEPSDKGLLRLQHAGLGRELGGVHAEGRVGLFEVCQERLAALGVAQAGHRGNEPAIKGQV